MNKLSVNSMTLSLYVVEVILSMSLLSLTSGVEITLSLVLGGRHQGPLGILLVTTVLSYCLCLLSLLLQVKSDESCQGGGRPLVPNPPIKTQSPQTPKPSLGLDIIDSQSNYSLLYTQSS